MASMATIEVLRTLLSTKTTNIHEKRRNKPTHCTQQVKFNSAFRLHYSLQLLPRYNEHHQLTTVYPQPQHHKKRSKMYDSDRPSTRTNLSILWVPFIFGAATFLLYLLSMGFYDPDSAKSFRLKFPTSIEDISEMSSFLLHMKEKQLSHLLLTFCAGYIYKQTFAIPGSVFLNLLAGALFGPYYGFALTCVLSAIGATNCYLLSRTFGRSYIVKYFPDKVQMFEEKVAANRDGLFFFLLFLRLFPMSPNWAMNMIAPIVGIPIHFFFLSVFIGLMPYNFICVQTGSVLSQISSVSDIFTTWTMLKMLMIAVVALLPGLVIRRLNVKSD